MVWIEMLPGDNLEAAEKMAGSVRDPRVRHFYDPRGAYRAGQAFAQDLLTAGSGPAWDVYLFYERQSEWKNGPPRPTDWMHQLGGAQRADPQRFHTGKELEAHLGASLRRLMRLEDDPGGG